MWVQWSVCVEEECILTCFNDFNHDMHTDGDVRSSAGTPDTESRPETPASMDAEGGEGKKKKKKKKKSKGDAGVCVCVCVCV